MKPRSRIAIAALLAAASIVSKGARAQLPDSPTGRRGNALIAALRAGEEAWTAEFLHQNASPEYLERHPAAEESERLRALVRQLGEVAIDGAERTGPFSVTLRGSTASGQQVRIHYDIEADEPHRITRLDIELVAVQPPLPVSELAAAAHNRLSELADAGSFSGVALVARGEEVLFARAYGQANRRYGAPNALDTAFNLGSIDKIFTQVALAQLAAAGKLAFTDTVAQHLPDYPDPEIARRITIQQLATHSAGLGDIFTADFAAANKRDYRTPRDYFPLFAGEPLLFEPGEGESYSNAGYMVLGAIIEAVSGESYHDYVRRHLFDAAGMPRTRPYALDDPTAPIATGYTRQAADHATVELHENTYHIPYTGTPAGGGYSTARDLLAFRHALVSGALTAPRYLAWMATGELSEAPPPGGLGLGVAGGGPGVSAALEIDGDWTVVALANLDPPAAGEAAARLRELIRAVERAESP